MNEVYDLRMMTELLVVWIVDITSVPLQLPHLDTFGLIIENVCYLRNFLKI